ncbi:MAG: hypothetical protein EBY80_10160 [Actinobacteria bacterium]|nr:hypothetical protein [Actinomycetota bacterium]
MAEAWIIDGVRSPRGRGKSTGSLHHIHPQELLAQVLNALQKRVGFDPADVDDVIIGNGNDAGDHGACIGRMAVLAAGWPVEAPGVTINRFCGSGQQAVSWAAMGVQSGHQDVVVAGGVESMSRWPAPTGAPDFTSGNAALREMYPLVPQGISADLIATIEGFTRQQVDELALMSQQRAARAQAEGRFDRSVVPILNPDGTVALAKDEHLRPDTTMESLSGLSPSFEKLGSRHLDGFDRSFDDMCKQAYPNVNAVNHVHHAGNSSGAHRAGTSVEEVPRACRHDHQGHRHLGDQRSLRRHSDEGHARTGFDARERRRCGRVRETMGCRRVIGGGGFAGSQGSAEGEALHRERPCGGTGRVRRGRRIPLRLGRRIAVTSTESNRVSPVSVRTVHTGRGQSTVFFAPCGANMAVPRSETP